jgi:hypothetical protein
MADCRVCARACGYLRVHARVYTHARVCTHALLWVGVRWSRVLSCSFLCVRAFGCMCSCSRVCAMISLRVHARARAHVRVCTSECVHF